MLRVKKLMTEVLLEVTDEIIRYAVRDCVSKLRNSRGIDLHSFSIFPSHNCEKFYLKRPVSNSHSYEARWNLTNFMLLSFLILSSSTFPRV